MMRWTLSLVLCATALTAGTLVIHADDKVVGNAELQFQLGNLLTEETRFREALDAYNRALSKRMSAVAANISDPDRHALAMLQIEALEEAHYAALVQEGGFWTHDIAIRADHCVEPEPDASAPGDPSVTAPAGPKCTGNAKALKVTLKVGPVSLKLIPVCTATG